MATVLISTDTDLSIVAENLVGLHHLRRNDLSEERGGKGDAIQGLEST